MVTHKALKARLKLLTQHGVSEYVDGDLRLVLGPVQGEEYVTAPPSPELSRALMRAAKEADEFDPTNPADLVLANQKIEQDN